MLMMQLSTNANNQDDGVLQCQCQILGPVGQANSLARNSNLCLPYIAGASLKCNYSQNLSTWLKKSVLSFATLYQGVGKN